MYRLASSPVQDVTFGTALKISLDNYYDLLKVHVGGLQGGEFLQLKLVADTLDLSANKKASEGGYVWFSYYNLLNRSDRAIQPSAVAGETEVVEVGLEALASSYERFLRKLRTFVTVKALSPQEQLAIADFDKTLDSLKASVSAFYQADHKAWKDTAEAMGFSVGDMSAYAQWSSAYGHMRDIERLTETIKEQTFAKNSILDRSYSALDDREVINAEFDFENPLMRLRYPLFPDFTYSSGDSFNAVYLATQLPLGSTALYEDRRAVTWDKTLDKIRTSGAGLLNASLDKNTTDSKSITTDWSGSGSGRYSFIKVSASASEHKQIQEEFDKGQKITLKAESTMRINMQFPSWFHPTLFKHRYVLGNPLNFQEFFGPKGSLLYYPTALIVVRGFSVQFESSQKWTYDYEKKFSASGGGGFSAFGIRFGASAGYSSNVKEHKVDQSNTSLTFGDDKDSIRFVGYAVMKNDVLSKPIADAQVALRIS